MINKKRLTNTFLKIVQIDSPTGSEDSMAKYLTDFAKSLNLEFYKDLTGNVVIKRHGEGIPLLLTAHIDTVEPGRNIKPVIENDVIKTSTQTILGADNKAAVAVLLELLQTIVENDINTNPLECVFTVSEEVGNLGALNLDYSKLDSKFGFSFDSAKPVNTIVLASPYYNRFDIKIEGKSSHAGKPENGINALSILNSALNKIKLGRIDKDTLCNIGKILGGSVRNTVPGTIELNGEVRSYSENSLNKVTQNIIDEFIAAAVASEAQVEYEVVRENSGFKFLKEDSLVTFATTVMEELNLTPAHVESSGCYDANIFNEKGIKVLNFGNGSLNNHTVDECISVDNLYKTAELAYCLVTKNIKNF